MGSSKKPESVVLRFRHKIPFTCLNFLWFGRRILGKDRIIVFKFEGSKVGEEKFAGLETEFKFDIILNLLSKSIFNFV